MYVHCFVFLNFTLTDVARPTLYEKQRISCFTILCDVTDPNKDCCTNGRGLTFILHRHFLFVTIVVFFFLLKTYQKHSKIFLLTIAILFSVILWWSLKYPQNIRQISLATIDRISSLYANVVRKMDSVFEAYLGQDAGMLLEPDDIPKTTDPVWILGKHYNAIQGENRISTSAIECRVTCLWCF